MSALLHPAPAEPRRTLPTAAAAALAVLGSALDDAVLGLNGDGRVVLANPAAEQLLDRPAEALVGESVQGALRYARLGSAALALAEALNAPLPPGAGANRRFTVHDAQGRPGTAWHVVRLPAPLALHEGAPARDGVVTIVVVRAVDAAAAPAPAPLAAPRAEVETLAAVVRELAGAGGDVSAALEQLALGALTLLGVEGACVVQLADGRGLVGAAAGTLAPLRGHLTELMAPPSLFAQAVEERRVLVVNAATRDPRVDPRYGAAFGMRQVLVAPLLIDGAVAAVLCAVNPARGAFDDGDGALAQRLADHGALALRNAQLVREAERAARGARLLADAGRALAQHVTPHSFFPALGRLVDEALGVCGFRILLVDRATRDIEHLYAGGTGRELPGHGDPRFWETAGARAVLSGAPLFVGDAEGAGALAPTERAYLGAARAAGMRGLALLPLTIDGETRGLLALHFPDARPFDADDRELLVDLAAQIAVAVRNVSLLDALRRAHARAEGAAAVARAALGAGDAAAGAAAILAALAPLVPAEGLAVTAAEPEQETLRCLGATGALAAWRGCEVPGVPAGEAGAPARPLAALRPAWASGDADAGALPAVLVPLVAHGRTIGDLCAAWAPGAAAPAPEALAALRFLAPTAALALDVLLLDERARRRQDDERRMAEQLRQAEKMAALGELVAGVAHEINNPLTGISAFAELLLEDGLSAEQRESARLIKREADRAVGVVRDLLAFSRKTEPEPQPLHVDVLLEHLLRMRGYALRAAGVAVTLDLPAALPPVHGDEAKLQQVFLNLLLNAEYALRDVAEPRLTVRARPAGAAPGLPAGAGVVVEVSDTGAGIPPDTQARIFEPFYTTKPPGEGTGLGLSVSYGIVQAHGGEITVRSAPGAGTTFAVRLPVAPPAPAGPAVYEFRGGSAAPPAARLR